MGADYYQSWWTDKQVLHIFPHWNWAELLPGGKGDVAVWAYTNADTVSLSLNGAAVGDGNRTVPRMSVCTILGAHESS